MITELFIDAETIKSLQQENRKLRLEITQARRQEHVEVIEITDRTADVQNIDFSQHW